MNNDCDEDNDSNKIMKNKIMKNKIIKYLAISGGGILGIKYIGVLKAIEDNGIIDTVEELCGSSVGGILTLLINIGYKADEMVDIAYNTNFDEYQSMTLENVFNGRYGLDNGDKLMDFISNLLIKKNINEHITFTELYEHTNKVLTVTGSCVNTGMVEYFNYKTAPNMSVIEAIRITIAFPFVYTAHKYMNKLYIDGAIFEPNPLLYFQDKRDKLGILSNSTVEYNDIKSFKSFVSHIIAGIKHSYIDLNYKKTVDDIIYVDDCGIDTMNFLCDIETKKKMYNDGYKIGSEFFN